MIDTVKSPAQIHAKLEEKKVPHLLPHYAALISVLLVLSIIFGGHQF